MDDRASRLPFYIGWIWVAFRHSWGITDYIGPVAGIIIAYLLPRYPQWGSTLIELTWQIPLGILGGLVIVRLLLAPYWMYKESRQRIKALKEKLVEVEKEKDELQKTSFAVSSTLAQLHLKGQSFRIAELARDYPIIKGRTFYNCHFHGPAIITFMGTTDIIGNSFDANLDLIFIKKMVIIA